jgi:hypothetical protein
MVVKWNRKMRMSLRREEEGEFAGRKKGKEVKTKETAF